MDKSVRKSQELKKSGPQEPTTLDARYRKLCKDKKIAAWAPFMDFVDPTRPGTLLDFPLDTIKSDDQLGPVIDVFRFALRQQPPLLHPEVVRVTGGLKSSAVLEKRVLTIVGELMASPSGQTIKVISFNKISMKPDVCAAFAGPLADLPLVTELNLRETGLSDDGLAELARGLKKNMHLRRVDLSHNSLTDQSADSLQQWLGYVRAQRDEAVWAQSLRGGIIDTDNPNLDVGLHGLSLAHNAIGERVMEWLADFLLEDTSFTSLDLSGNTGISEKSLVKLGETLTEVNSTLMFCDVSGIPSIARSFDEDLPFKPMWSLDRRAFVRESKKTDVVRTLARIGNAIESVSSRPTSSVSQVPPGPMHAVTVEMLAEARYAGGQSSLPSKRSEREEELLDILENTVTAFHTLLDNLESKGALKPTGSTASGVPKKVKKAKKKAKSRDAEKKSQSGGSAKSTKSDVSDIPAATSDSNGKSSAESDKEAVTKETIELDVEMVRERIQQLLAESM